MHLFETETRVPLPIDRVFAFFSDAGNLEAITPPWLHFHMVTPPPIVLRAGALLDYRLRVHGVPIRWRTEIVEWSPPHRFVDRQLRGPYRRWVHTHTFEAAGNETVMRDRVEYAVPGWILEPLVHRWLVEPDVRRIFKFREEKTRELLCTRC
jgi:ligand-binding SRPBCC domain-containing protein